MENIGNNANEITIQIPEEGEYTTWKSLKENCFNKISSHDHQGSGKGRKLKGYACLDHTEAILPHGFDLQSRNAADNGNVEILRYLGAELQLRGSLASATIKDLDTPNISFSTFTMTEGTGDFEGTLSSAYSSFVLLSLTTGVFTISDGTYAGQVKIIQYIHSSGTATITPAKFANGSTITMNTTDCVMIIWSATTDSWHILANNGAVIA